MPGSLIRIPLGAEELGVKTYFNHKIVAAETETGLLTFETFAIIDKTMKVESNTHSFAEFLN